MSGDLLSELLTKIEAMPEEEKAELSKNIMSIGERKWTPSPGPQTEAYFSEADQLLYGGQGGGGKTDLEIGLAYMEHKRTLILRRQSADLGGILERAVEVHGSRDGFSGGPRPKLRPSEDQLIEFGGCKHSGDEESWQGQPHDLICFDEACQFLESQVRFIMGWNRSADKNQRCRVVMASNPPVTSEGQWLINMFAPWLDPTFANPAKQGELRWVITDADGKDRWVDGPEEVEIEYDDGVKRKHKPVSRTFISASLQDNPFLKDTGYAAVLDALPEPLRSAIRDGNFMAARQDDPWQVIPTDWVRQAQKRWIEHGKPSGVPMCALAADIAQGGADQTVMAMRYDGWYDKLLTMPGKSTPDGKSVAGLVVQNRRDDCKVVLDMGGGYGGAAYEHLKDNDIDVYPYKGAEGTTEKTAEGTLGFYNVRAAAYWRFREALDPSQPGGSPIMLPDDPEMVADLTAPTYEVGPRGVKIISKEDICKELGRSTDKGDAVVMAWYKGAKRATHHKEWANGIYGRRSRGMRPQVTDPYAHRRNNRRR